MVFASSPPLPVIFSGALIAKFKKVPLVTDIRDIWPDSAVAVGMMKKNFTFRALEKLEKAVYRQSSKIIVNAKGIYRRLEREKGVPKEKMIFLPNGAELDIFRPDADYREIEERYSLRGKFVALYTGLIGLAQAPEIMIGAAKELSKYKNISFLIVGDGPLKKNCEELAKQYSPSNIIFTGERPRSEMPQFTSRANVTLIPYKNSPLFKDVIPSKIFDYMAAAKPVIINLDGEGAAIIKEAGCGFIAEPENPTSMAENILKVYKDKNSAEKIGVAGHKFVEENYNRSKIAAELEITLRSFKKWQDA